MNWLEEILIICGISLDIFAGMECQGALVPRIEKKQLSGLCGLMALWQLTALYLGNRLSFLLCQTLHSGYELVLGQMLAALILCSQGIRLLLKAWKNERIVERREEKLGWKRFVWMAAASGFYTFLTGVAFGFLETGLISLLILTGLFSMAVVALGMYTGYRLGFQHKFIAYLAGGALLLAGGADVVIRYIIQ